MIFLLLKSTDVLFDFLGTLGGTRCPGRLRMAIFIRCWQCDSNTRGGGAHILKLRHGKLAPQHHQATVGGGEQARAVDVLQCQAQPLLDRVDALYMAAGDCDDTQNYCGVGKFFQQCQIIQTVCVFYRYLLYAAAIDRTCQLLITAGVRLQVVGVVEMAGIPTAHMHDAGDIRRYTSKHRSRHSTP